MARSPKLTDTQLILLTTAAQRADGCLLPPAASIATQDDRVRKAIPPLIKRTLVEEAEVIDAHQSWRCEAGKHIGVIITEAGRAAVGVKAPVAQDECQCAEPASALRPASKIAHVLELLRRPDGASLAQMVDATGWLPHTTRAALTGLRKKGHMVTKKSREGVTIYHAATAA